MLFATRQIRRNITPILKILSFVFTRSVVNATHPLCETTKLNSSINIRSCWIWKAINVRNVNKEQMKIFGFDDDSMEHKALIPQGANINMQNQHSPAGANILQKKYFLQIFCSLH